MCNTFIVNNEDIFDVFTIIFLMFLLLTLNK